MVRIGSVVLHVDDLHRAARFWADALRYVVKDGEIGEQSPVLVPRAGHGPSITLDEDDRTHLDLFAADKAEQQAEIERLIALGARRVPWTYASDANHVVLADTEGNLFCVAVGFPG
jgi:Glyoxalase-like domain